MRKLLLLLMCTCLCIVQSWAQNRTITGKVLNEKGEPVHGASVTIKGMSKGANTDESGIFSLSIPPSAKTLIISAIGYEEQHVSATQASYDVKLKVSEKVLDEVVVQVPYGTQKKTAFTGSEGTITAKSLEKQQLTSITKAIEGLVPGITTTNGGGQPGSTANIMIRGVGSYAASSSPLWVLDGVPYDGGGTTASSNMLSALNMDDIASVTVLKDAAATVLYGSRAANGVIMLTSKKGLKGKASVSLKATQGYMSRGIPEYDRVDPKTYYELMWEATRNNFVYGQNYSFAAAGVAASNQLTDASHLVYDAYNVPGNKLVDPVTGKLDPNAKLLWNDSWSDALYRTAQRQNVNLSISGAGEKNDYLFSLGYLNEDGIVKHSGYKRYNARLNLNTTATTWLKAGLNIDGALANQATVPSGGTTTTNPFYYTRQMGPIYPIYQHNTTTGAVVIDPATGQPALDWGVPSQMGTRPYAGNSNLVGSLALDDRSTKIFNGNANTYLEAKFLNDFTFRTTLGGNYYDTYATTYQNSQHGDADNVKGRSTKTMVRQLSYTFNEVLTWTKVYGDHSIKILAGHENYQLTRNYETATRTGFAFPGSSELDNASVTENAGSNSDKLTIESYFSNANYEYKNRYLFSASFRRDGTSRFYAPNRWGNFYSFGAGWRVTQEDFMKSLTWLNDLKLRTSYGVQGNQNLLNADGTQNYYVYQNLYSAGNNNAGYPGYVPSGLPSPNLLWEGNKIFNVGLDFSILNRRVQGTIEYFNRTSNNLIFPVPVPASTGFVSLNQNIGALVNKGIEVTLGYNAIMKKDWDWRIDVNLTHFKNEFTKLPPGQTEIISGTKKIMVGHSIYDWWIREYAGVDPATGDALFYKDVLDANGKATGQRVLTNNASQASFYYEGSALPKISGGVTNSLRYKNFDLSVLVTFSQGGKFYDGNFQGIMHPGNYGTAWATEITQRWQKPGDITNVPRLQNGVANQDATSTRWLFDASWCNIKNITLSYRLPADWMKKIGMSGIQVFGNIDNVYLFTAHKGMDPQRAFTGVADATYTPFRTVTFGANFNF